MTLSPFSDTTGDVPWFTAIFLAAAITTCVGQCNADERRVAPPSNRRSFLANAGQFFPGDLY